MVTSDQNPRSGELLRRNGSRKKRGAGHQDHNHGNPHTPVNLKLSRHAGRTVFRLAVVASRWLPTLTATSGSHVSRPAGTTRSSARMTVTVRALTVSLQSGGGSHRITIDSSGHLWGGLRCQKLFWNPSRVIICIFCASSTNLKILHFFEKFTLFFCNNFTHCKFLRKCAFFACLNILIPNLFSRVVAWGNCLSTNPQHLRLQTPLFRTNFAFFKYCI